MYILTYYNSPEKSYLETHQQLLVDLDLKIGQELSLNSYQKNEAVYIEATSDLKIFINKFIKTFGKNPFWSHKESNISVVG